MLEVAFRSKRKSQSDLTLQNDSVSRQQTLMGTLLVIGLSFVIATLESLTIQTPELYWSILAFTLAFSCFLKIGYQFLIALALWAYLPTEYISQDPLQTYLNPSSLLFIVILLRCKSQLSGYQLVSAVVLACYLIFTSLFSVDPLRSFAWSFQFLLLFYSFFFASKVADKVGKNLLIVGFSTVTISLLLLAFLEFLTSSNLLYNGNLLPQFEEAWRWQNFSIYRVTTTLGHPLNNGMFFATASLFFLRVAILEASKIYFYSLATLCIASVFLSGSRSAILAFLIGAFVWLILDWRKTKISTRVWLIMLAPTFILSFMQTQIYERIFVRIDSGEGLSSQLYRQDLLQWAGLFSKNFIFGGSGPGTSGNIWLAYGNVTPLENGFFQLWVSLGLIPTMLLLLGLLAFVLFGIRRQIAPFVTLIPALIYLPLTNFIDAVSSYMIAIILFVVVSAASRNVEVKA